MPRRSFIKKPPDTKSVVLLALVAAVLLVTYIVKPGSFTAGNANQILLVISYLGIMGVGVSFLLISGGIDFAAAAHATCSMLVFTEVTRIAPALPAIIPFLAALAFGALAGAVNAALVEGLSMTSFIATIGMASVWNGVVMWYTKGGTLALANDSIIGLTMAKIGRTPVPWVFVFVAALLAVYSTVLNRTRFGRSVLMIGGNAGAARLAGLNPAKIRTMLYINTGALSAVCGVVFLSLSRAFVPKGLTQNTPELTALTATILGGVSFMGGAGKLSGAFLGIILIQVLSYALQILSLPLWIVTVVNGLLLLIALLTDAIAAKGRYALKSKSHAPKAEQTEM
ncbi:MAG: ABC transporter permease [Oscillospiraceae bacterium]|jgi:ribose transport system permease protein|nr:ABC transporter permease [Oscillospiraceae bacterium]